MMRVQENVPLAPLTTFQIGGPARYLVEVTTKSDICEALEHARTQGLPFYILGGGSNILAADKGFDGLVIRIVGGEVHIAGNELRVDAGCNLWETIQKASESSLGGWEKLAGIPGTVGGAVRGNAGAFGTEIKDVVVSVKALNTQTLKMMDFVNPSCEFVYRSSFFKTHPQWIIASVQVRLAQVEIEKSLLSILETVAEREKRHLQNVRAAGSYFTNPVAAREIQELFEKEKNVPARGGRVPAGWLIEKVGMKGARVGDAEASEQHPNYLKNTGHATAAQVLELARQIKDTVQREFGIMLTEEAALLE